MIPFIFVVLLFSHFFIPTDAQLLKNHVRNSINYCSVLTRQIPSKVNGSLKNIKGRFDWVSPETIGNNFISDVIWAVIQYLFYILGLYKIARRCFKIEIEEYYKNKSPPSVADNHPVIIIINDNDKCGNDKCLKKKTRGCLLTKSTKVKNKAPS